MKQKIKKCIFATLMLKNLEMRFLSNGASVKLLFNKRLHTRNIKYFQQNNFYHWKPEAAS